MGNYNLHVLKNFGTNLRQKNVLPAVSIHLLLSCHLPFPDTEDILTTYTHKPSNKYRRTEEQNDKKDKYTSKDENINMHQHILEILCNEKKKKKNGVNLIIIKQPKP